MTNRFRSFQTSKRFVHKLKIKSVKEWREYCKSGKKPKDIPAAPNNFYKKWKDWTDWLGTKIEYWKFKKSREYVRKLKILDQDGWVKYYRSGKLPKEIPKIPWRYYKDEWISLGDWLGTGVVGSIQRSRMYRSFEDAKKWAHQSGIQTAKEWKEHYRLGKIPKDIPGNPDISYKKGLGKKWKGWGDFLGTNRIANQNRKSEYYRSFEKAVEWAHAQNLRDRNDWRKLCKSGKIPKDIPLAPHAVYKKEWKGYGYWYGTMRKSTHEKEWPPWKEAKPMYQKLARKYKIKNMTDWRRFTKTHNEELLKLNLSPAPWYVYSKESVWRRMK